MGKSDYCILCKTTESATVMKEVNFIPRNHILMQLGDLEGLSIGPRYLGQMDNDILLQRMSNRR